MKKTKIRWKLMFYDALVLLAAQFIFLVLNRDSEQLTAMGVQQQAVLSFLCVFFFRFVGNVYQQIWRYGGIQCYVRLLFTDFLAFWPWLLLEKFMPIEHITAVRLVAISTLNLLGVLAARMMYRYAYKCGGSRTAWGRFLNLMLRIFAGPNLKRERNNKDRKIKIAILGAGRVGVSLAEELLANPMSAYTPRCFLDISEEKIGREIHGIPVLREDEASQEDLKSYEIQEIVFAVPNLDDEKKKERYQHYLELGYKIKVYDYPVMQASGGKRQLRDFDIEELLVRKPIVMLNEQTLAYYRGKTVLITGGGGSIGSELCRQLAKMNPASIVIADIYENGAYGVQQELKMLYGDRLRVSVEIVSITNKRGMFRLLEKHHPQIVINAAAHKHVPLMETNCIEAVENNVFGTMVLVELCETFGVERFMMVSTDKAVNPTSIMGATKRMCEMIIQSASTWGRVKYSATRFGNVLGSAGSVIPLFKKQIDKGGPVTVTDRRIIRYFMTIPEASQLVLESGVMARNGELFVLDMGQPVRIFDLARNIIRLSGAQGIEIVETGLRPGEKLYEELLIKTESLEKTNNNLIFIERDLPLSRTEIAEKLRVLQEACRTECEDAVRDALHQVVPTYRTPKEVNDEAERAADFKKSIGQCMKNGISVR